MSEPTPGPWKVCHHESTAVTVRGADDMPVAEMWKTALRNDEANAALIARAPELLEENTRLRELLRECREYVPVDLQDFIKAAIGE